MPPLKRDPVAQSRSNSAARKGSDINTPKGQKTILSFLTKGGLPTPVKEAERNVSLPEQQLKTPKADASWPANTPVQNPIPIKYTSLNTTVVVKEDIGLSVAPEEGEDQEPYLVRRNPRRAKRKIFIESEDDEDGDLDEEFVESPKKSLVTKKLRKSIEQVYKKGGLDNEDVYRPQEQKNCDSELSDEDEVEEGGEILTSRKSLNKKSLSKTPENKLKAFVSGSALKGGPTLNSPPQILTATEKKKQRAAEFKAKNEERYSWLLEVKDANGNLEGTLNYDPRTLYIPPSAWKKFTPFEKQFWDIKSLHWDTVVFFKKGKFYELYERDADIGHTEFDLKLTDRTNMRMVGVPESSFEHWASQFIAKGYKVGKVDQMETALGKEMREKASNKKEEKIIRRELTSILTAGTLVDGGFLTNDMGTYSMAIKEDCGFDHEPPSFGICFVDTAIGEFNLASFKDDVNRTQFETLIIQLKPREIIYEKRNLSKRTQRILKDCIPNLILNPLDPESQFWNAQTTIGELNRCGYFEPKSKNNLKLTEEEENISNSQENDVEEVFPMAIQVAKTRPIMMSALGGLLWYLRSLKLDMELVSLGNFHVYDPIRHHTSLILDGQTLANLEVFENNIDGSDEGTLFKLLNRCISPFGKRTFKRWLCHPLRMSEAINERLDAVDELSNVPGYIETFNESFKGFPDLERLISRIHAGTCPVKDFLLVLSAFQRLMDAFKELGSYVTKFESKKLLSLFARMPDLSSDLEYFKNAFDHKVAETEGNLIPYSGIESDYDEINDTLKKIDQQLAKHLLDVKKSLGVTKAVYKDVGKEIYQIEISNAIRVPDDWRKLSSTKLVNRYWNPTLQKFIRELQEAQETKNGILKSLRGRFYEKFDSHYKQWLEAVKVIAEMDCLLSLAKSSMTLGDPCCRPEFIEEGPSVLMFENLRHPCVVPGVATDFIPNDTYLGGKEPNLILLTGPNMGGKSTLLRQNCVAIIMAQLGCYVPASRCVMTPFDRIYTRIGANDNILAGQSTFMVELAETSKILHEATPRSMVILDELGRGTSTFDGYAIAYAVLHYLATHIGCLALFSTHYGTLTQEFAKNPNISLKHMSCQVDSDLNEVTFLYKLVPGVCPKSYGMKVASMAGVPRAVIDRAEVIATKFEQLSKLNDSLTATRSDIAVATQSDFSYLINATIKTIGTEDGVGDRALDNQTEIEKKERQARVLKAIICGIRNL
ncbi:hypothetical protein G9A89_016736 [Geosiphon pyriformis]|nr:hypothetical protein G9A89_016736 [Geosiphon pyriformis]